MYSRITQRLYIRFLYLNGYDTRVSCVHSVHVFMYGLWRLTELNGNCNAVIFYFPYKPFLFPTHEQYYSLIGERRITLSHFRIQHPKNTRIHFFGIFSCWRSFLLKCMEIKIGINNLDSHVVDVTWKLFAVCVISDFRAASLKCKTDVGERTCNIVTASTNQTT